MESTYIWEKSAASSCWPRAGHVLATYGDGNFIKNLVISNKTAIRAQFLQMCALFVCLSLNNVLVVIVTERNSKILLISVPNEVYFAA